jgi:hypothetical protein
LRRITQPFVGTALRFNFERERAGRLGGNPDRHAAVIGLDVLVEGLVELDLTGWNLRLAQRGAGGAEFEALAVHVVAVCNLEGDGHRLRVGHRGREAESRGRIEELLVGCARAGVEQARDEKQQRDTGMEAKTGHDFLGKTGCAGAQQNLTLPRHPREGEDPYHFSLIEQPSDPSPQ